MFTVSSRRARRSAARKSKTVELHTVLDVAGAFLRSESSLRQQPERASTDDTDPALGYVHAAHRAGTDRVSTAAPQDARLAGHDVSVSTVADAETLAAMHVLDSVPEWMNDASFNRFVRKDRGRVGPHCGSWPWRDSTLPASPTGMTVRKKSCQGVLRCSACKWQCAPATKSGAKNQHGKKCSGSSSCEGILEQQHCSAILTIYETAIRDVFRVEQSGGQHKHAQRSRRYNPSDVMRDEVAKVLRSEPHTTGLGLQAPNIKTGRVGLSEISPSLANIDRVNYIRRADPVIGTATRDDGREFVGRQLREYVEKHCAGFWHRSDIDGGERVVLQNDFMRSQLLDRSLIKDSDNNAILTDAAHKFFKRGWLIISSIFDYDLQRHVPVQLTWTAALAEDDYVFHFGDMLERLGQRWQDLDTLKLFFAHVCIFCPAAVFTFDNALSGRRLFGRAAEGRSRSLGPLRCQAQVPEP